MGSLANARKHMSLAIHAEKTSLFNWFSDYPLASNHYEKAAASFQSCGELEECILAWEKAAVAHEKAKNDAGLTKALESAGIILLEHASNEKSSVEKAVHLAEAAASKYRRASCIYRENGNSGKAASCLSEKAHCLLQAAESLPSKNEKRISLENQVLADMLESCSVSEQSGHTSYSLDIFRNALNFVIKLGRWKDAIDVLDRVIPVYIQLGQKSACHKARLSKVILNLKRNDATAAGNAFREGFDDSDYLRSDECAAAEDILVAWKNMDDEKIKEITRRHVFNYLDRQVSMIARDLSRYDSPPVPLPSSGNAGVLHSQNPEVPGISVPHRSTDASSESKLLAEVSYEEETGAVLEKKNTGKKVDDNEPSETHENQDSPCMQYEECINQDSIEMDSLR